MSQHRAIVRKFLTHLPLNCPHLMNANMASTSQKRPATARMHTTVSPRKKARTNDRKSLSTNPVGTWLVKASLGECPPYTDHAGWVEDGFKKMIYMFGGIYDSGKECNIPTSDFYSCDTTTMEWRNLTDKLRFRDPSDPFGLTELRRRVEKLPPLSKPGITLVRINGVSFVFIFGGYSLDEDKAVSTLIAVDVDHLEWWYVTVEGGPVAARINPVVVAVEQRIYIFGGYRKFSKVDPQSFTSYSIACYQPALRWWTWEAADTPYTGYIPPDQFGAGIAVYGGKKIMLTPGKLPGYNKPLNFAEKKIFYFHTEHRQFQMIPHLGHFPNEVLWYSIHNFPPSSSLHPCPVPLPSRKRIGHPPTMLAQGPASGPAGVTPPTLPSVILCAWVPHPNSIYAVPELWRLSLSHSDEIRCLNKSQPIWDLNHDFQGCVAINDRIILLGNNNPAGGESWNIHLDVVLTPEDRQDNLQD